MIPANTQLVILRPTRKLGRPRFACVCFHRVSSHYAVSATRVPLTPCVCSHSPAPSGCCALRYPTHLGRVARFTSLDSLRTTRFARLASLDSLRSTRFARLASLDSLRSTRFARLASLDSRRSTHFARLASHDSLRSTRFARLASLFLFAAILAQDCLSRPFRTTSRLRLPNYVDSRQSTYKRT
jgi:hypothetical protein